MSRLPRPLALAAAFSLLAAAATTAAQTDAPIEALTGRYRYAESAEAGQRRVMRAVEPLLRGLNPLVRPLAESRVREARIPPRIDLTVRGDRVAVRYVGREEERTFRSRVGRPRNIRRDSGEAARLTQVFRNGQLQQIFEGPEGGRWYNLFSLDPSGRRMTLNVVVTHERLGTPIRVELPYERIR